MALASDDPILAPKLALVKAEEEASGKLTVSIMDAVDLSTHPDSQRISFPYPDFTPHFRVLDNSALSTEVLDPVAADQKQAAGGCSCFNQKAISKTVDVSSSPDGVCLVTCRVFTLSNSHAGSHADQPGHFLASPPFTFFDDRQYNGISVVLDISEALKAQGPPPAITKSLLESVASKSGLDFSSVSRILLKTYAGSSSPRDDTWDPNFAYLHPECARWLGSLPKLILFGTDAASVDHPSASPIIEQSHGGLWSGRVAILEGLNLSGLASRLESNNQTCEGVLHVKWLPTQMAADAKGALVTFFPQ